MAPDTCFGRRRLAHSHWVAISSPALLQMFCSALGSNVIPVTSKRLAVLAFGDHGPRLGWVLDIDQLSAAEVDSLARRGAEVLGESVAETRQMLLQTGLNVPASAGDYLEWSGSARNEMKFAPSVN